METKRKVYLDYIRVLATITVIMIHIVEENQGRAATPSEYFYIGVDSLFRWCVPLFLMISGVLFLNKTVSIKSIYTKYVPRILVALIFYSILYMLLQPKLLKDYKIYSFVFSGFHLWYLYLCIGIYIFLPVIKAVVNDIKTFNYFMLLSIIFFFFLPEVLNLILLLCSETLNNDIMSTISRAANLRIDKIFGYVTYFMLGYALDKYHIKKKQRIIIYVLGIIGVITSFYLQVVEFHIKQNFCQTYYNYITINVFFISVAMFVFFKYRKYNHEKMNAVFNEVQKYTFGIYLIHLFIYRVCEFVLGMDKLVTLPAPIFLLVMTSTVFVISFIYTGLIKVIPKISDYLT